MGRHHHKLPALIIPVPSYLSTYLSTQSRNVGVSAILKCPPWVVPRNLLLRFRRATVQSHRGRLHPRRRLRRHRAATSSIFSEMILSPLCNWKQSPSPPTAC